MKPQHLFVIVILAVTIIAATLMTFKQQPTSPNEQPSEESAAASIGGDFTLTSHEGKNVSNSDFNGKYRLIYFGFTNCPHICPTDMGVISESLYLLNPMQLEKIQPLFISIDPERDTPEKMKDFLTNFHPKILGLTGDRKIIDEVVEKYRIYAKKITPEESMDAMDYDMNHSTYIYLMDENGHYHSYYSSQNMQPREIAGKLRFVLG